MSALEQSLDVPGLVARLTGANDARDRVVARAKELMAKELLTMSDDIATHPEVGFEEKRSVQVLTDYLRQHDFERRDGVAGLPTAFVAKCTRKRRRADDGDHPRVRRAARHQGLVSRRSAQRAGSRRHRRARWRWPSTVARREHPAASLVYGTPGEEMMPPNAKTVMHEAHVVRRRRRHRPQPRRRGDVASGARLRQLLSEHRRREVRSAARPPIR